LQAKARSHEALGERVHIVDPEFDLGFDGHGGIWFLMRVYRDGLWPPPQATMGE
jgi:hypothetical protein